MINAESSGTVRITPVSKLTSSCFCTYTVIALPEISLYVAAKFHKFHYFIAGLLLITTTTALIEHEWTFFQTIWIRQYQNVSIQGYIEAKDDGVPSCSQIVTNTQVFTGWMPFLTANRQCQSTEWKSITFHGLAHQLWVNYTQHISVQLHLLSNLSNTITVN